MKKRLLRLTILILALLIFALPAKAATAEPDSVSLTDIEIFEDLITDGDFLAVVPYSIPFTTLPSQDIDELFIFKLLDESGVELGSVTAYPYNDKGYGSGVVSFYLESGTTWESAYNFQVVESPVYFPSPNTWDFMVGPSNYSSSSDQATALRNKIISLSQSLGTEYDQDLLTTSEGISYLSTYGESYFLYAIPGLSTMAPGLFYTQVRSPSYDKRSWTYTFASSLQTRYSGTFIDQFMTGFSGLVAVDTAAWMNIVSMIMFVLLILAGYWKFKATTMSSAMDGYALLILMMLNGFFSLIICGFIAFAGLAAGGVVLFLNRS